MAYTTNLGEGITVRSTDMRLSRGKIVRKHTVLGGAESVGFAHIIESREARKCSVYMNSTKVADTHSLAAAYEFILETARKAG